MNTPAVFGHYIDIYDISRAVEDGATVPLYYESRLARIELDEDEKPRIDAEVEALRDGRHGSATIHQDAAIHAARLDEGRSATLELEPGRRAWLQVARGKVALRGYPLEAGDAMALTNESEVTVEAHTPSEIIVFDLPGT